MKKSILTSIVAATLLSIVSVMGVNAAETNNTEIYKITDVTTIQRVIGGYISLTEAEKKHYDFNQDGKLSIADATSLQYYLSEINGATSSPSIETPSKITVNKDSLTLGVGEKYTLVVNSDVSNYNMYFTSSDSYVAKVSSSGTIEAVGEGSATITLKTDNNLTATCELTVKNMAQSLTLNASNITLGVNEVYDLNSYLTDDTYAYFRWYTSDNADVAPVEKNGGLVTAKSVGTATITCKLYNGVTATCKVTVKAAPTSISFHQGTEKAIAVGDTFTLSQHTNTNSYAAEFRFKTSNSSVIAITKTYGNKIDVVAKSQGTASITVSTYNNKTATFVLTVSGTNVKCLDISEWQGYVDYSQVKTAGYDYVILRAGYGRETYQKDARFEQNYTNAKAAGLKVGVYWFSYAMSPSEAELEANACLYVLNDKKLDMPVYYDMEYSPAITGLSKSTLTSMATGFCTKINNAAYSAGVYSSESVFDYSMYLSTLKNNNLSIWNAQWSNYCTVDCDVWQFTDAIKVNGISGYVDCNYIYNLNIVK